jgi:carbonyl reductase 1
LTDPPANSLTIPSQHAVQTSTEHTSGFNSPGRSYNISKALLRAATTLLARECDLHARASDRILVNCCCPGWIDTEMGGIVSARGTRPPKSPEDGARIPVRLALEDLGGVSGEYWANESVRSRGSGEVQKWD